MPHASNRATGQPTCRRVGGTSSRRAAVSQSNAPSHSGGVFVNSPEIISLQLGIIADDLIFAHTCREPAEHVPNRDPQSPDAGLTRTFTRLDLDSVTVHWCS